MRDLGQGKDSFSLYLTRCTPGQMTPDPAIVGYFLDHVGEDVMRQAATPVASGREKPQVRNLGAILEYWRRGAAIMRLELLAERAMKEGRHNEAKVLYEQAIAASEAIILYVDAQPTRGWLGCTVPAAWRKAANRWRANVAGYQYVGPGAAL